MFDIEVGLTFLELEVMIDAIENYKDRFGGDCDWISSAVCDDLSSYLKEQIPTSEKDV